ncbi:hypothetical protein CSUB01_10157 [Colletotrichum sublineola]|uniref:Uncharacterized protein n=1 Tax=Colletotrichum sublineola TaxID=1173701 RepID=A0A066XBF4_COLSU|nr:hypothetical protein CSUB01_10157 [Colletotrichum sublineola]
MDNHDILAIVAATAAAAATTVSAAAITVIDDISTSNSNNSRRYTYPGGIAYATRVVEYFLGGSEEQFAALFRMGKADFHRLAKWLRDGEWVKDTIYQSVEQQLLVFLYLVGQGETQRNTAHLFQIAQSTVGTIVHNLLTAMVALHSEVITQPDQQYVSPTIELSPRDHCFTGCIGAVDGTLLKAHIPLKNQKRFFCRKGYISQNVLAAVNFDGLFVYVMAGAEGSINDASLMKQAISRSFKVPTGRYYLGDAGFACSNGIVTPYPGERYHLREFAQGSVAPATRKELYNIYHSRLRVVVEKAFGKLKRTWKILRAATPEYSFREQIRFVYATTALYNFVQKGDGSGESEVDEEQLLARASGRADITVGNKLPIEIRHNTAIAVWENRAAYLAARDNN